MSTLTDHGGAASKCSFGALKEIINRLRAKVGLHQACVNVYSPGYYHTTIGFYHLDATWNSQVLPHLPEKNV